MVLEFTPLRLIFYSLIHVYFGDVFKLYPLLFLFVRLMGQCLQFFFFNK